MLKPRQFCRSSHPFSTGNIELPVSIKANAKHWTSYFKTNLQMVKKSIAAGASPSGGLTAFQTPYRRRGTDTYASTPSVPSSVRHVCLPPARSSCQPISIRILATSILIWRGTKQMNTRLFPGQVLLLFRCAINRYIHLKQNLQKVH